MSRRGSVNSRPRNTTISAEVARTTAIDHSAGPAWGTMSSEASAGAMAASAASVSALPVSADRTATSLIAPNGAVTMAQRRRAQAEK